MPRVSIASCVTGAEVGVDSPRLLDGPGLGALAREHGLTVVSTDSDFGRFRGVAWLNPVTGEERRSSARGSGAMAGALRGWVSAALTRAEAVSAPTTR
jgi:hypothetical protein